MAGEITGRRKPTKPKKLARAQKRKRDDVDVDKLEKAVTDLAPSTQFSKFEDLPLSEPTKAGLKACHFSTLTDIQSKAIPLGLKGRDILGAAKTGSGKTLAFVIPVLENLYRSHCVGQDAGLGAMIISPTRELAVQIFDVLYKIGKRGHLFAAGLIIGGKSLQEEQQALVRMNIVVCTPGRILQHLSETAAFNVDNLQMLVLDEADRLMDMGFQRDVDAIVDYLPRQRQTLLFSATQTKRVSDLARLSLQNPEYVAVHEAAASATPQKLQQNYVLTPLPTKLDTLWSFIQSSKKAKIVVFFSSGKQVRYVYESFRKMQPGIPLLHLHGRQKQTARHEITSRFTAAKYSCLFSTDVAARGLDFPSVDWVIQVDCPEDADTYIHRVGRTARYEREGRAVLLLDPSEEEGMLEQLAAKRVPIERINVRTNKQKSIRHQLQGLCFKDPELKYLGQKAFASYARSLHLQKDKKIFDIEKYEMEDFAASLGLPGAPRIKFVKGDADAVKKMKNAPRRNTSESEPESSDAENGDVPAKSKEKPAVRTKYDRMFERRNQDVLTDHYSRMVASENEDSGDDKDANQLNGADTSNRDEDDDLFTVKRRIAAEAPLPEDNDDSLEPDTSAEPFNRHAKHEPFIVDSNRRAKALKSKKKIAKITGATSNKLVFDDETGEARPAHPFDDETSVGRDWQEKAEARRRFVEEESRNLKERDVLDKEVAKQKRQDKKAKRKEQERDVAEEDEAQEERPLKRGRREQDLDHELPLEERPFALLDGLYDDNEPNGSNSDQEHAKNRRADKTRPKKWFERDEAGSPNAAADPETLEDLEALAKGVLV